MSWQKYLIYLPLIFFALGLTLLYLTNQDPARRLPVSIQLPPVSLPDTPTPGVATPSAGVRPTPESTLIQLESDLRDIQADVGKMRNEDGRLIPPAFLFDLKI